VTATRAWKLAIGALLIGAFVVPIARAGAGSDDDAEDLLRNARKVAVTETFAGIVEVRWVAADGKEHVEQVGARSIGGSFAIGAGDQHVLGQGFERYTAVADDVVSRWGNEKTHRAPSPSASWQLEVARHRTVAERPAVVIVARDDDGEVRARFAIDEERGQLLRREVLDRGGRVVHSVEFVKIITGVVTPAVPQVPKGGVRAPIAVDEVPAGFIDPDQAAGGYDLLGRYVHADGMVQLYYGDGLFTLSVFEQPGQVDWAAMPAGQRGKVETLRSLTYTTAVGTVIVFGKDGVVFTAIGDGPADHVIAAVAGVAGLSDEGGALDDVVDFVFNPFSWG
jgi:hypothetical protein